MTGVTKNYRTIATQKKVQQQGRIPKEWLLTKSYDGRTNFMDVPMTCGILSDEEIDITSNFDATALLEKLKSGIWSTEQVTIAFCKRAAIAHQLVRFLPYDTTCCITWKKIASLSHDVYPRKHI